MAARDNFKSRYRNLESPANHAFAITPSDTTDLAYATRAIYVGGDGSITAITVSNETITLVGVKAGSILPISVRRVTAASTATNLVGLY